jgi:hypothetical protein
LPSGLGGNGTPPAIPAAQGSPGLSSSGIVSSELTFPIPASGSAKDGIAVNTQALRAFAANLDLLSKSDSPLVAMSDELDAMPFLPGAFHTAIQLQTAVIGSGGLRDQVSELFRNIVSTFGDLSDNLQQAAKAAEKGEGLNNMSSDDYAKYFGLASGTINQLNGGAGSSSGAGANPATAGSGSSSGGSSSGGSSSGSGGTGASGGGPSSGSGKSSASGH